MLIAKKLLIVLVLSTLAAWTWWDSSDQNRTEYEQAVSYYKAKKYFQALRLFEEIALDLSGNEDEASAYFYQGHCNFHLKDYEQSAAMFSYFYDTFPTDDRIEDALYMQGLACGLSRSDFRLDQTSTEEGVVLLKNYLQQYPDGKYVHETQRQLAILQKRLLRKELEIARLYCKLGEPKASLLVIKNLMRDFEGACYSEEVTSLNVQAQYQYFKKNKDQESADKALRYCRQFLVNYPESTHTAAVSIIEQDIHEILNSK